MASLGTGNLDIKCVDCGRDEFTVTVQRSDAEIGMAITCDGCRRQSKGRITYVAPTVTFKEKSVSYAYLEQRPYLFTDDGQRLFLKIRDSAFRLLDEAGAVRLGEMVNGVRGSNKGSFLQMVACADRMVELRELLEVPSPVRGTPHYRLFIRPDPED